MIAGGTMPISMVTLHAHQYIFLQGNNHLQPMCRVVEELGAANRLY